MFTMTRYAIKNEDLIPWVKFIWYFNDENANINHKLLPTDSIDVLLNLSDSMTYVVDSKTIAAQSFHVNGLRNKYSYIRQTGKIRMFGISFYPFGLFPFIHKPLRGIQDEIIGLHELSLPLVKKLEAAVSYKTVEETIFYIEESLCSELQLDIDYIHKSTMINEFINEEDSITIQSFCRKNGFSVKTFERLTLKYTGYTPKTLRQIKRFQTTSNQLIHESPTSLTNVAYDNNFTDQAHFIKEFRRFSGAPPRAFQQEKISMKENIKYNYL